MADLPQSELRLGVGAERINPPLGVPLPLAYSGGGSPVAVEGRYDDCWARALVLEQGETRLAQSLRLTSAPCATTSTKR